MVLLLQLLYRSDRLLILIGYICISGLQIFAKDHVIPWCHNRRSIVVSVLVKTTLRCLSKVILLH